MTTNLVEVINVKECIRRELQCAPVILAKSVQEKEHCNHDTLREAIQRLVSSGEIITFDLVKDGNISTVIIDAKNSSVLVHSADVNGEPIFAARDLWEVRKSEERHSELVCYTTNRDAADSIATERNEAVGFYGADPNIKRVRALTRIGTNEGYVVFDADPKKLLIADHVDDFVTKKAIAKLDEEEVAALKKAWAGK